MTNQIKNEVDHVDRLESGDVHDETDLAQHLQLLSIASIQKQARERANKPLNPDFDGVHCVECGEEIPKNRLAKIRTDLCVDCQQEIEDMNKLKNR